jgi:hypothetical protein
MTNHASNSPFIDATQLKVLARQLLTDPDLQKNILNQIPTDHLFSDGIKREVPMRIHGRFSCWNESEELIRESRKAFEIYSGGDLLDVGAFQGYYSFLFSPKAGKQSRFVSIEGDARVYQELLATIQSLSPHFQEISYIPLPLIAGDGGEGTSLPQEGEGGSFPGEFRSNGFHRGDASLEADVHQDRCGRGGGECSPRSAKNTAAFFANPDARVSSPLAGRGRDCGIDFRGINHTRV